MKQWICIVALLLVMLLCLGGCQTSAPSTDSSDSTNVAGSDNVSDSSDDAATEPEGDGTLTLFADGSTEYVMIVPEKIGQTALDAILSFIDKIKTKTGVDLFTRRYTEDDQKSTAKEIIIGSVFRREESAEILRDMSLTGYRVEVVDQKIVIGAFSPKALQNALLKFSNALTKNENGDWTIEADFSASGEISRAKATQPPVYETAKGNIEGVYPSAENNYTVSVDNTNVTEYQAYLASLKAAGFTEYATNQIGDNLFATYTHKTADGIETAVHTMFYPNLKNAKVVYGPKAYLPSTEAVASPETPLATPRIVQVERLGANNLAPGLSIVMQLADASFIIVDGGPQNATDAKELYDYMVDNTPGDGKPVISAWIITHAHGDHIDLPSYFLNNYRTKVELRTVMYNFPDFTNITQSDGAASSMGSKANSFKSLIKSYYKEANMMMVHSGQQLKLAGCTIDVIFTPEDVGSDIFKTGNHTCITVRVTIGETTFLVLGDSETTLCGQMAMTYKSALKCDVLQPSHHGFNGGDLSLYKYVNPEACFWAVDLDRFNSQDVRKYAYNTWLIDNAKYHYTASFSETWVCK